MAERGALALALLLAGCGDAARPADDGPVVVTITGAQGDAHRFTVELADSPEEQERGLMFRPTIAADGGMLFAPYPARGGGPAVARFWMKNTPSPLDIIFIRADGSIARIAENTPPQSEDGIESGEPVVAVLELRGGRTGELGIAEGDRVTWPKPGR